MAIINTLQKCLDSPYLFEDKEAPDRIGGLLAKAADRLEAAANIQYTGQGDPADISFLSYEAMFCCLRALVYAKGYREAGPPLPDARLREPLRPARPARRRPHPRLRARPGAEDSPRPRTSPPPRRSSSGRSRSSAVRSRARSGTGPALESGLPSPAMPVCAVDLDPISAGFMPQLGAGADGR